MKRLPVLPLLLLLASCKTLPTPLPYTPVPTHRHQTTGLFGLGINGFNANTSYSPDGRLIVLANGQAMFGGMTYIGTKHAGYSFDAGLGWAALRERLVLAGTFGAGKFKVDHSPGGFSAESVGGVFGGYRRYSALMTVQAAKWVGVSGRYSYYHGDVTFDYPLTHNLTYTTAFRFHGVFEAMLYFQPGARRQFFIGLGLGTVANRQFEEHRNPRREGLSIVPLFLTMGWQFTNRGQPVRRGKIRVEVPERLD